MDSDDQAVSIAEIDRMPLSAWYEARKVPRSTAFKLVKLGRIETQPMRVPYSRAPVASVNAEQMAQLDHLVGRLTRDGLTMAQLEAELSGAMVATSEPSETDSDSPTPAQQPFDQAALLARLEAGERAIATGLPLRTSEMAWLLQARPGGDRVDRAGVVAIRHGRDCWQLRRSESD
jgi:hypothetical protein